MGHPSVRQQFQLQQHLLRWRQRRRRLRLRRRLRHLPDDAGHDPTVFDCTFGTDASKLAGRMLFLLRAGEAVGTCTAWEVGGTGWVHSLAVATHCQGLGLSKLLLAAVLARLRDAGHATVMLACLLYTSPSPRY